MGDSIGPAAHDREHLERDDTVLLVEPFTLDGGAANSVRLHLSRGLHATECFQWIVTGAVGRRQRVGQADGSP